MAAKPPVKARKVAQFGWVPDLPDARDYIYSAPHVVRAAIPSIVDLRPKCPPVYDQGELGSCTGHAIGAAVQFDRDKQKLRPQFRPSRLFIYYNERLLENTVLVDSGAMIRDGIKTVAKMGVCPEQEWPYDITKFANEPPVATYMSALKYKAALYSRVPNTLAQMRGCLAEGYPFTVGFTVYESFESDAVATSGVLDMPKTGERVVGGHAVLAVGYDDAQQRFIIRNSYGTGWGQKGYFTMPYAYLTDSNLADDFWTIRVVSA